MSTNQGSSERREHDRDYDEGARRGRDVRDHPGSRREVVGRERDRYGGIKWGSAFFGWLAATGVGVLLIALLSAAGAAFGFASGTGVNEATNQASQDTATVGLVGGILLLVVLFLAYFSGGYVAGRMARFDGAKQGFAVWIWALLFAIVIAILGAVAGTEYDVLAQLNLPRIPLNEGELTTGGIIAAVAVAAISLVGAILGGLSGMRYHRKVDKAGLGA